MHQPAEGALAVALDEQPREVRKARTLSITKGAVDQERLGIEREPEQLCAEFVEGGLDLGSRGPRKFRSGEELLLDEAADGGDE